MSGDFAGTGIYGVLILATFLSITLFASVGYKQYSQIKKISEVRQAEAYGEEGRCGGSEKVLCPDGLRCDLNDKSNKMSFGKCI